MVTSPFVVVFWRGSSEKIGGDIVCVVCVCGALGGRSSVLSPCKIALLIVSFCWKYIGLGDRQLIKLYKLLRMKKEIEKCQFRSERSQYIIIP